jgi:2-polyprenyl-3-methyl-5-hydroxy-6-metoxy-1,4-benzoquinol methylase
MSSFHFKQIDPEGLHTLEAISDAARFNAWMFEQVQPFMKGKILEIGSGIGNISKYFIAMKSDITLSDIRENYCNALQNKFPQQNVLKLDLVHPDFANEYADLLHSFDSTFALNVIEHIEDDALALKNMISLIKPGGSVFILVPAGPYLYNEIDKGLLHFKRYKMKDLLNLFSGSGLFIEKYWHFNALGIPAWFTGGKIMKKKEIEGGQMNTYDKLVPIARILDKLTLNRIGLSVIAVGTKR